MMQYQILVQTEMIDFLWEDGRVYDCISGSRKIVEIVLGVDSGEIEIENFSHCLLLEYK